MNFSELQEKRYSVRSYIYKPMSNATVREIISAGIKAPNACNLQPWHFYAVCDREKIRAVNSGVAHIPWADDVPLMIVACVNDGVAQNLIERFGERGKMFVEQDVSGAINHMMLRAAELGLGSCWVGPLNDEKCRKTYGIAGKHRPVALVTFGTPADDTGRQRSRKPLEDVVTFVGAMDDAEAAPEQEAKPFELRSAYLPDAVFDDLFLGGATYNNINMKGVKFNNINMEGVKFTDINMTKTFFGGLNLSQSYFGCVDMNEATFENPCFDGAVFKNCSFKGVTFEDCEFGDTVIKQKDGKPDIKL